MVAGSLKKKEREKEAGDDGRTKKNDRVAAALSAAVVTMRQTENYNRDNRIGRART